MTLPQSTAFELSCIAPCPEPSPTLGLVAWLGRSAATVAMVLGPPAPTAALPRPPWPLPPRGIRKLVLSWSFRF
jgi:hypothetical protein